MKKHTRWLAAASMVIVGAAAVPGAAAADVGLNAHAGTMGLGLGLDIGISDNIDARIGFNRLDLSEHWHNRGLRYKTNYDFRSFHALVDWHTFGGSFRVTGGIMTSNRKFKAEADVDPGDKIGNRRATKDGRLKGKVEYDDLAPYLGAGWDWQFGRSGLGVSVDLGLLYQGNPDVSLKQTQDTGVSQQQIDNEKQYIDDEYSDYDVWPVAQVGAVYRF